MASELERLRVVIEADVGKYSAGMKLLERATGLAIDGAKSRLQGLDKQLRDTSKTASSVGALSRQVFAPLLAALGAREVL